VGVEKEKPQREAAYQSQHHQPGIREKPLPFSQVFFFFLNKISCYFLPTHIHCAANYITQGAVFLKFKVKLDLAQQETE
jgi:hypothetical protein